MVVRKLKVLSTILSIAVIDKRQAPPVLILLLTLQVDLNAKWPSPFTFILPHLQLREKTIRAAFVFIRGVLVISSFSLSPSLSY